MSDHISITRMEKFCSRNLEASELAVIGRHIASCPACLRTFQDEFQRRRQNAPVIFDLSPESWVKHEHFDSDQLVSFVENTLDKEAREIAETHIALCENCLGDVNDLVSFRHQIEAEIQSSSIPTDQPRTIGTKVSWLDELRAFWKPSYFVAACTIIVALIVVTVLVLNFKSGYQQKQREVSGDKNTPIPAPSVIASALPNTKDNSSPTSEVKISPTPETPDGKSAQTHRSKREKLKNNKPGTISSPANLLISLNDGGRKISIYNFGRISGLEDVQPKLGQSIIAFLSQEEITRPGILAEINGIKSALRGTREKQSFKLLSPVGSVITDVRPKFKWELMQDASSYQVYIIGRQGRNIAKSEKLSPNITEWVPEVSLTRGEIYSWSVVATVGSEEIVSPPVPEPEATFKVLESQKVRELDALRRKTKSSLALGVFYAREGMIEEAEREFQRLHEMNPESPIVSNILRIIRSWR